MTKTCTKCGVEKPLEAFGAHKLGRNGVMAQCRACNSAAGKGWREANKGRKCASGKAWYEANRDAQLAAKKAWRQANPERARAINKRWREANRARNLATVRSWQARNPEVVKAMSRATRHARRAAGSFTAEEWLALLEASGGRCHWCEESIEGTPHADHVVPLARGGAGSIDNVVVSCAPCNLSKGAKLVEEWLQGKDYDTGLRRSKGDSE